METSTAVLLDEQPAPLDTSAAVQPGEQTVPVDPSFAMQQSEPAAPDAAAADPQSQTAVSVADAAAGQASAQAADEAAQQSAASSEAPAPSSPSVHTEQNEFSAGVKDFNTAFDFVQQGLAHLGAAAKEELVTLARKYL